MTGPCYYNRIFVILYNHNNSYNDTLKKTIVIMNVFVILMQYYFLWLIWCAIFVY